jgi:hypothetical protein
MIKIGISSPEKDGRLPNKPRRAKRTVGKVSSREGSGTRIKGLAGSDRTAVKTRKPATDPKSNGADPTTSTLHSVREIPIPLISDLAEIGLPDNQITPQQLRFPVYGNYCGFGHGDPTGNTPPIDAVDAVCREHDLCYRLLGDFDGRCDRNLIEIMPSAIASTPSPVGKKAGLLALLYFSLAERNLALGETLFKRT